ncbi:MAG TPA: cytochrome d ubiquinol oxidase subunit II [Chlamydiales bacterium]|nr:cytochrome d ubiquinol oxidase subunit II [Chlamydiales bacterium]
MLETLWYGVIGLSILFYVILDGFDLGVGSLHLLAKSDLERRIFLNAIGPVWDGNEVWIVVVMGGLFAGFPDVYATVFSGFYTLFMFLIAALVFRAAAIEFRSKRVSKFWRQFWDVVFSFSSILVAFVVGLIAGNLIEGIALNEAQDYVGTFFDFFKPYSLLVGITAVSVFAMHGAIYLSMKTEGEAHKTVERWINPSIMIFVFCYFATTIATLLYMPYMSQRFKEMPYLFIFPLLAFIAIINIPYQVRKGNDGWAFVSSCLCLAFLLVLYGFGTFPTIVLSTIYPEVHSLTIYNSSSSQQTLSNLLIVVLIGVPLILAYGFWIYRVFRGKVRLEKSSY